MVANDFEDAVLLELDFQVLSNRAVDVVTSGHLKKPHSEFITLENHRFVHGTARADPPAVGRLGVHAHVGIEVETLVMLTPLAFNGDRYLFLSDCTLQVNLQIKADYLAFKIIAVPSRLYESLF